MARPKLTAVRGVKDILPEESPNWRGAEHLAREIFTRYGYGEIRVPVFERTELFSRGIGEGTDIVSKEMYTFKDKGGDSITLRPEATASICRAYVQNGLHNRPGVSKLFCIGPMFRYERSPGGPPEAIPPDRRRGLRRRRSGYRRRTHRDADGISGRHGGRGPGASDQQPGRQGMPPGLRRRPEGISTARNERVSALKSPSESSATRWRFLDSKDPDHQEIIARAPRIDAFWNDACRAHLSSVCEFLEGAGVTYAINPRLVRGLDYYCLTVFEVTSENLGAQNAVCGGGRYDGLVEELGGPPTPAIGFAIGMERLLQLAGEKAPAPQEGTQVYIVALGDAAQRQVFELASELRAQGIRTERSFGGGSMKSQMKRADRSGATFVLLLGDDEAAKGVVSVRHMAESRQSEVKRGDISSYIKDNL